MSTNGAGDGAPPVQVQPSPLPMQWLVATAVGRNGEKLVVLQLLTPQGTSVFFIPPESAVLLGEQILDEGRQASTGLTLPQVVPPPDLFGKPPGAR